MSPIGTSRWAGKPVPAPDYEDLPRLAGAARKARSSRVEFEWTFTAEELDSFRSAIFSSAVNTAGRYRAFDTMLLKAINIATGDLSSSLALPIPKDAEQLGSVSCNPDGIGYRIVGSTTFDIFFGHSSGGVSGEPWTRCLLPGAKAVLLEAIKPLGWDVERLCQPDMKPIRNALYGMPVTYGVEPEALQPVGPPKELSLHFHGPFSAFRTDAVPCLFDNAIGRRRGIYLWTIEAGGSTYVWYVGQTKRSFVERTAEHIAGYLSGEYLPVDVDALVAGRHSMPEGCAGVNASAWPDNLPEVLDRLPVVIPHTLDLLRRVRFFVAPVDATNAELDRVEGAIARWCRAHNDSRVKEMIQPGLKVPSRIPGDRPLRLTTTADSSIAGLEGEIVD